MKSDQSVDETLQSEFESLLHGGVFNPRTGDVKPLPHSFIPLAKFVPIITGVTPVAVDLAHLGARTFLEIREAFNEQTLAMGQLPELTLPNGWYKVGPGLAEYFLRFNRPDANRQPSLGSVRYYWRQMQRGQWKPTGEPLIFDLNGAAINMQHRCWAALLGHTSFITYVVSDAPAMDNAFAYIDNGKIRTAAEALKTAGFNGTSPLIAALVNMSVNFEEGAYTCQKKRRTDRLTPIDVLEYVNNHPLTRRAAHLTAGEYKGVIEVVGHKDVVAFVAYKILVSYGEETLDKFMEDVEFDNDNALEGNAGHALRAFFAKQKKAADPLAKHLILAHLIKGFNAWVQDLPLKSVKVATDDDFPEFVEPVEAPIEAELVATE